MVAGAKRYAARASAATLGFIWKNVPGARRFDAYANRFLTLDSKRTSKARSKPYKRQKVTKGGKKKKFQRKVTRTSQAKRWYIRRTGGGYNRSAGQLGAHQISKTFYKQKYRKKVPGYFKQILAPKMIQWTLTQKMGVSQGKQSIHYMLPYMGSAGAGSVALSGSQISDMLAQLALDDPQVVGAGIPTTLGSKTIRYWMDYYRVDTRMKNQTNRDLTIRIYTMTPRRVGTFVGGTRPHDDWEQGLLSVNTTTQADLWSEQPGASPFRSPQFCRNWKVLKSDRVFLREGQEHQHHIFLSPKYPFSAQMIASGDGIWPKLTIVTMVVINGSIVVDDGDAAKNVTTSSGQLHMVTTGAIRCRAIGKNRMLYTTYGNLDNVSTGIAMEKAIDDESHLTTGTSMVM